MGERYRVEEFTHEIAVEEYLDRFHNPDKVWDYCRACKNYGQQWGCPPFNFDVVARLAKYRSLQLLVTKITLLDRELTSEGCDDILLQERVVLDKRLLELERTNDGLACTFIGKCLHCGEQRCARLMGKPCRHPELIRPSLEAYGFDVAKTLTELFGLELQWSAGDSPPKYLLLVCGLFHN